MKIKELLHEVSKTISESLYTRLYGLEFTNAHDTLTKHVLADGVEDCLKKFFTMRQVYYLLNEGEKLEEGDEWYNPNSGTWHFVWKDWVASERVVGNSHVDHLYRRSFVVAENPQPSKASEVSYEYQE